MIDKSRFRISPGLLACMLMGISGSSLAAEATPVVEEKANAPAMIESATIEPTKIEPTTTEPAAPAHFQQLISDSFEGAMQGESRYIGHVRFSNRTEGENVSFGAAEMLVKTDSTGQYQYMQATGNPALFSQQALASGQSFEVSAQKIEFLLNPNRLIADGDAKFVQKTERGDIILVSGSHIELTSYSADSQSINASGTPLTFSHQQTSAEDSRLQAEGKQLEYNSQTRKLRLQGDVVAEQGNRRLTAGEIFYDGINGVVSVPKIPNQQLEIIQSAATDESKENP